MIDTKTWVLACLGLVLAAAPGWANTYGTPAHDVAGGQLVLGFVYDEYERTYDIEFAGERDVETSTIGFNAGVGITGGGLLSIGFGAVSATSESFNEEMTGIEGTIAYRHNFDFDDKLDEGADAFDTFRKGLLASVRIGNVEDSNGTGIDYYEYNLGAGVGTNVIRQVQAYAGGVISIVEGTAYSDAGSDASVDSVDPFGVFAGLIYAPQDNLHVGAELHLVHEWGFGLFVEYLP